jgi:membrane protein YqaA with SNARE-associated domain
VSYGYPGIFLISLIASATVIFPAPSLALVFALGGVLDPILVGLVAGLGEALGELTGYLAGYSGQAVIEKQEIYDRLHGWMRRYGLAIVFLLSLFPNPFFDLAGIAAGALRFPVGYFLLSCWLGKTLKTIVFALVGAHSFFLLGRFL